LISILKAHPKSPSQPFPKGIKPIPTLPEGKGFLVVG